MDEEAANKGNRMKIGIDIRPLTEGQPTGVGEYARQIVQNLLAQAPQHEFILFASGASPRSLRDLGITERAGVTLKWLSRPNKVTSFTTSLARRPVLDRMLGEIDVFFSPNFNFSALSPNCPHVITVHDLSFATFPKFLTLKRRVWHHAVHAIDVVRNASHVICDSESTKRDVHVECGVRREHISVIPLGVGTEFVPDAEASQKIATKFNVQHPYILSIGTREPRKNLAALIEAYDALRANTKAPVDLVLAGPRGWKNTDVSRAIAMSKNNKDIHVLGFVAQQDRPALVAGALVLAMVSSHEGFGLPIVEAMRSGVPVVTAQVSSLPEVCRSAGIIVDPERPKHIAQALQQIIENAEVRDDLIAKGLRRAAAFSWEKTAAETLKVLESVADNKTAPLQGQFLPTVEVV